jgi:hypothetical protein
LPEKVLLLRIRQKPPETVRDFGLSMVAVGCGVAALATRMAEANNAKSNWTCLVPVPMVSEIVNWGDCGFQVRAFYADGLKIQIKSLELSDRLKIP